MYPETEKNHCRKSITVLIAAVVRPSSGVRSDALCTSGYMYNVMFARNRPDKRNAKRADTQSDSPGGSGAYQKHYNHSEGYISVSKRMVCRKEFCGWYA